MSPAPVRLDDARRLAALRESGLLDSASEEAFDRLTRLATRLLGVPIALVTLVDGDRQFFKSCVGLPEPLATTRQTPLTHSFCQHTVTSGKPLIIEDARVHPLVRENPSVPELGVVAYAGIPLSTSQGVTLGTFCAIDTAPKQWTESELATLRDLAASAATEIELRLALSTARQNAEAATRAFREREEFLNSTSDGVYTVDHDGRVSFINRAGAEMLGYSPDEVIGKIAHQLFHHSHPDGTRYPAGECPIARAVQLGTYARLSDEVLWRRDGSPLQVAYASSPLRRDGEVVGAVVRFTDVADQRRAERGMRLLAESGRMLSSSLDIEATLHAVAQLTIPTVAELAMVDLIDDGEVRRVAATHSDERITALLERARNIPPRLDDHSPQSTVMRSAQSMLVPEVDDEWLTQAARGPEHAEVLRALAPRSIIVVPIRTAETVLGALTVLRLVNRQPFDEHDCEVLEELGRRAALAVENARLYDAARRATRARDDMLGVVSHDLRNPIHSIYMGSSFLIDLLADANKELERDQARIIKRAAQRANRLIQDLLDITHLESGQLSIDRRPHNAASLIDEAVELAAMQATEQGITLERGPTDDTIVLLADRDRVLQALGNLIGNALKFTPRGGRVVVAAACDGDCARVTVTDTGSGIPREHLARIFDRYWQANRKDRRGVGLGLSIVKGITEAHGGSVTVDSTPGEGSTFTLRLPLANEPEREVTRSAEREGNAPVRRQPERERAMSVEREVAHPTLTD